MTLCPSVDYQRRQAEGWDLEVPQMSALLHDIGFISSSVADIGCGTRACWRSLVV
jgi:hypothetical protein